MFTADIVVDGIDYYREFDKLGEALVWAGDIVDEIKDKGWVAVYENNDRIFLYEVTRGIKS